MDGAVMPVVDHLEHVNYPATKKDLMEACEKMSDVSEDEKKMIMDLPEKEYQSADDVKEAMDQTM